MASQQTFSEAYGQQPANPAKGSWLARVSHRASHIPNRPQNLAAIAAAAASTPTAPAPGAGGSSTLRSRDSLPLRSQSTSGFVSHDQLPVAQKTSSYPSSPVSPTETEFGATPIDPSFGDRTEPSAHNSRAGLSRQQGRTRSGTATQADVLYKKPDEKMDKYSVQAGDSAYDSDAEADDEFERSIFTSPTLPDGFDDEDMTDDHASETEDEGDSIEGDDTPTTQGWGDRDGRSPTGKITQWTEDDVADWVATLGPNLKQYADKFVEEGISGEIIITLHHDELLEIGIPSAGHRLTILKAVYEQKMRAGVRIDEDDYIPASVEDERNDATATQEDIARIIQSLRMRDQRIVETEKKLESMQAKMEKLLEENRKLREEMLPMMRLLKDQRTPLPDPSGGTLPSPREPEAPRQQQQPPENQGKGSSLSRKFSKRILPLGKDGSKQSSPTVPLYSPNVRDDGQPYLEASAAAVAASSHLTASMSQASPNSVHAQQLSPTSPAYSMQQPPASAGQRPLPRDGSQSARPEQRSFAYMDDPGTSGGYNTNSQWSNATTLNGDHTISTNSHQQQPNNSSRPQPSSSAPTSSRRLPTPSPRDEDHSGDPKQVEIFKSFRVSIDDPCRVVLPVALKRYQITDDWRQYALYIVHGDQERCLGLEEKPLMLFKQLDREGRKPMFMLRRHASPQEGWSAAAGMGPDGKPGASGGLSGGGGFGVPGMKSIPGGVL